MKCTNGFAATCGKAGYAPISSGRYQPKGSGPGEAYFICAADIEGKRPGYNLAPNWNNA
ncbi:hypothetical protein SR870_13990 [Rhodopseudomonas palustris]|uniref:hypothetical protein n=1 Tax=Rhodopseudomonas palustris TaxID=1076 RepID=UPI002ACE9C3E|nr:hypothetical protein [Rhodopseudomonas palustris]WQG97823.1 hypothetical protein SR870_13990 [Rhodopseudomonas palustris]